jgi:hypothetical protein
LRNERRGSRNQNQKKETICLPFERTVMNIAPRFLSAHKILVACACAALIAFSPSLINAQNDPPPEAGRVSFIEGSVMIQPVGLDTWGQAEVNMPLGPGDRIFASNDGRAEIQIGRTYIRLGTGTDASIIDVSPMGVSIGIAQGRARVHCFGLWPGQSLHVSTPSGAISTNSPGDFRVDIYPQQQAALFTQYSNFGIVTGAGGFSSQLPAASSLELMGTNPVVPQWMDVPAIEGIDTLSMQRDQQIMASVSYRYVSSDIGGAYELDANGEWAPQSPYGPIWFPRVQGGWAPYHNGHWVSHAPWGWVWVEQEPWGYAPFHYGRWVVFNGRWGWVPGPPAAHPVWSPALVVFAGGNVGGGSVSAWFPLGPGEPYRPWYPCSPGYVDRVNITNLTPTATVHVAVSYAGFNFGAVAFTNRAVGITAISQADFAAGRPVTETNVVVINKTVINNITIVNNNAPPVQPNPRIFAMRAPAQPVPVSVARPTLINEKGMTVSASAGFKPAPPPVRPAPQVQALPGHKTVAPPAGVKMTAAPANGAAERPTQVTPAGKPEVGGGNNPNQAAPNQGPHPSGARPSELTAKPAGNANTAPANQKPAAGNEPETGTKPAQVPGQPMPKTGVETTKPGQPANVKPGQNPNQKPGTKPEDKSKKPEEPKKDKPDDQKQ